jgi:hypothetical protein
LVFSHSFFDFFLSTSSPFTLSLFLFITDRRYHVWRHCHYQ